MGTLRQSVLEQYAVGSTFIETGSMEGWTMHTALEYGFETMHGIELMQKYYDFSIDLLKNHDNVHFWLGESPDILSKIVENLSEPATFWLDAHASGPNIPGGIYGGCPLIQELEAIRRSPCKEHVIMIDDVRLFGTGEWDFLEKQSVLNEILKINPSYKIAYAHGEEDGAFPNDILIASTFI
jgi:hypothetical protein